jgi:maleylpyruvate isomerase
MAVSSVPEFAPEVLIGFMQDAHRRESTLIKDLTDEQARAESALPGWSRGHVIGSRLAFIGAAGRQIECAMTGQQRDFFDGGRPGRDAEIETYAHRPAAELIMMLKQAVASLEASWATMGPADWTRPAFYRGPGPLTDVLKGCWRETEIHSVDLNLGVRPAQWSAELCVHLFGFLEPRVPEGTQLVLAVPDGRTWELGSGERVVVSGALADLAAWLSGRKPDGPVESSTGSLPTLRGLRMASARAEKAGQQ